MSRGAHGILLQVGLPVGALLWASPAWAASGGGGGDPSWVLVLLAASLLPFVLVTITSYAKIAVVLHILRTGLGAPGVPPTLVITALAVVLSGYVMAPTASRVIEAVGPHLDRAPDRDAEAALGLLPGQWRRWAAAAVHGAEPIRQFLNRNSSAADRTVFADLAQKRAKAAGRPDKPKAGDLVVALPAFVVGQLRAAFQIGFLLLIPFLVLDLLVANVLLALGLHAVTPASIALPLKLLLFVAVDGWTLLARGLVLSYG